MPKIHHELLIGAPAEKVYDAITSQEGLSAWWTPDTKAKPEENSTARFGFGPDYFKEMRITELKPPHLVKWLCIAGAQEWKGTTILFELRSGEKESLLHLHPELRDQIQQQNGDRLTVIIFQHEDWKEDTPMYAECNYTWARFLRSLKQYIETGKGLPWPNQHRTEL